MAALTFSSTEGPRRTPAPAPGLGRVCALADLLSRLTVEWRLRREIRSLEGFDDTMLQDIGVSRGGIEDAVRHGRTVSRR